MKKQRLLFDKVFISASRKGWQILSSGKFKKQNVFSKYLIDKTYKTSDIFRWSTLENLSDDCHKLVALTPRQIAFLAQTLEPGTWEDRWKIEGNINEPDPLKADRVQWVRELEFCLYMGCDVKELITTINNLSARSAFELSRISYNLDRIRDNLDSIAPDGGSSEYGLATILAALGPNVTKSTEYLKNINSALNSNAVSLPDESGEFAELGNLPSKEDIATGEITSVSASYLGGQLLRIQISCLATVEVLIEVSVTNGTKYFEIYRLEPSGSPSLATVNMTLKTGETTGIVEVLDHNHILITDTF